MQNPCLSAALKVLAEAGVRDVERVQGGKHLQLRWRANGHALRIYAIPGSPSDWRSEHNTRADVRRLLREDGIDVATKPEPLPPPPPPKLNRVDELERRIARLEELVRKLENNCNVDKPQSERPAHERGNDNGA